MKFSTNKFELLMVVWASEHGAEFKIVTDHKALVIALSANHSNITMHSRLTRWVNTMLCINFKISHIPGDDMGFIDLLYRLLSGNTLPPSDYDKEFVVASIEKIQIFFNRDYFNLVNGISVERPSVAVNANTFVKVLFRSDCSEFKRYDWSRLF